MQGKRIKWGNLFVLILVIAAAAAAFYYKNPDWFSKNKAEKSAESSITDDKIKEGTQPDDKSLSGDVAAQDGFIMGLDSWIGGTPALIALNREYNKDYLLDMSLKYIPNDGERIKELAEGRIHATEMSLPSFIRLQEKYPDTCLVVGITDFSRGADGIVASKEVKDLNDMEGRTVSFVKDGTGKFILNRFLRLTGLRYQDIEPLERNEMGEVIEDMETGRADLIVSWSPDMNLAVKRINQKAPGTVRMLITTKEVPNLVPTVLVVNKKAAGSDPDSVKAFLKTWYASVKYIIERPEKAYDKLMQLMNEKQDEYGEVALEDINDSFSNIKLMSLNDNLMYFNPENSGQSIVKIVDETILTWKKYGDIGSSNTPADALLAYEYINSLKEENDSELLVDTEAIEQAAADSGADKDFKQQDAVSIEKNTEKVAKVDIPPVYYDSGKASVKQESIAILNTVCDVLIQFPEYYLVIDAHTDSIGNDGSNLKLSKDRAEEVRKYLISKGINPNRIIGRGWGEYKPVVALEKNEEDRAKNRRTEFTLTREKNMD